MMTKQMCRRKDTNPKYSLLGGLKKIGIEKGRWSCIREDY